MFIDTHTHISEDYGIKPEKYIENAINNNVGIIIVSICEKKYIDEGLELAKRFKNVYLTVGYHPDQVDYINDMDISYLEEIVTNNEKVVGIGEIGLDYHYDKGKRDNQIELFKKQLDLAEKLNLPVVIHSRDATNDTYEILSKYNLVGDIHCFSGSVEYAKKYIDLGYFIGIGGVVTFSNSKLYQVVEEIGLSNIILETDSPYLSPKRGEINESSNIPIIAEKIASTLNTDIDTVMEITTRNALSLYKSIKID